jgi:hypothetical protein
MAQSDYSSAPFHHEAQDLSISKAFVIKGTNGKEELHGTSRTDYMYGYGGDDVLWGMRGSDYLKGGDGDDNLNGGTGTNQIYGGAGDDYLSGWTNDYLEGGSGNDKFDVWRENVAIGGSGNDHFYISNNRPSILGGSGYDIVEFRLLSKNFVASYKDGVLLLRTDYDGFYKPQFQMTDPTIEKIVWKDFELTLKLKSTPTITQVYAQESIEEGGTTTAPFQVISGQSDPFARIRVMADDIVIGTCVADNTGKWHLYNVYSDLPEGPYNLTAVADYGAGTKTRTSESFDIVVGLPGGEIPGEYLLGMDSDEITWVKVWDQNDFLLFGGRAFALGDVNGDGRDDWLTVAEASDGLSLEESSAYVVYGQTGTLGQVVDGNSILDVAAMTGDQGFRIQVDGTNPAFALAASAGDLNGDGSYDLLFGSRENGSVSLKVVFTGIGQFGSIDDDGRMSVDPASLSEDQLLTIRIRDRSLDDQWRWNSESLRSVGDVNGDGIADLVVGISDSLGSDAYLIYGSTSPGDVDAGERILDVEHMDASQGVHLSGYGVQVVEAAGDVNGDGLDDFIVGARYNNIPAIAVVFGNEAGVGAVVGSAAELDLRNLDPDQGLVIKDNVYGFQTSVDVESLGDFNGDGRDDLLIQSHDRLTVVFGSKGGFGALVNGQREIVLDEITADEGFTIDTNSNSWQSAPAMSKLGDFNGDGFDDFAVLRPQRSFQEAGKCFVIFGTDQALATANDGEISLTLQDLDRSQAVAYSSGDGSVSAGGDLNGDGYDDLICEGTGSRIIIYGHATSSTVSVTRTGTSAADILIGKAGADILDGNGGADIFRGGRGNDTIRIGDATIEKINAGRGAGDTVEFDGSGITLDARDFGSGQLLGIETFDLTGSGDNTLILTAFDVFHLSPNSNGAFTAAESGNSLVVRGDDGDTLRLIDHPEANWTLAEAGIGLDGSSGGDFDVYHLIDGARILASVAVSEDVTLLH